MSDNNNMHKCENCECMSDNLVEVIGRYGDVELWCEECAQEHAYWCEHCETWHSDETIEVTVRNAYYYNQRSTEYWCPDCVERDATQCDDCEEYFAVSEISEYYVWNHGYRNLCNNCYENNYYTCWGCGDLVTEDDVVYVDDDAYCPDCAPHHSENLQSYGHTHGDTFHFADGTSKQCLEMTSDDKTKMFFGLELETDDNDDASSLADDIADAYSSDYVVCKEDGSLSSEGVEIVSQPMEPRFHIESGMWDDIADIVKRHGGKSHDAGTCGLHIHISRAAIKDQSAYRIDRLFHRFSSQLIQFSRRTDSQLHWCGIKHDGCSEIKDTAQRKATWKDKKRYVGRYEAVNDTNLNTIEIRLWRGTLNIETLYATIELTAAIALVANACTDDMLETISWSDFKLLARFALSMYGLRSDELVSYLSRRGL